MKTLFITGATKNTGLKIAEKFAKEGYNIALTSRSKENAKKTAKILEQKFNVKAKGYGMDLCNVENIKQVFECVKKDFTKIDTFVANSANLGMNCGILNTDEENFGSIVDVNIKGTFFCCQCAAEIMKESGGGNIVTIGSVQANGGVRGRTVYSMTKAAISALTKNLAYELGEYNIRANNLVAGAIHSERWDDLSEEEITSRRSRYPVGRESTEEEIANGVYFLGSELSASTTGTDLTIDSGISICMLPYSKSN